MKNIVIITIEEYIFKANYDAAIEYMIKTTKDLLKNEELLEELEKLKSFKAHVVHQKMNNSISLENFNIEVSKIVTRLVKFKIEIQKHVEERDNKEGLHAPEIELLIYTNAYATLISDMEMLAKTYHSEIKNEAVQFTQNVPAHIFDLEYEVHSIEITELEAEFATALVLQSTSNKNETIFRDNTVEVIHTFLKENGRWIFYSSVIQELIYK